ncbi:LacI family transcriptional regulator [Microbacterium endophyticum]|uniref:LacI family transcriptional regulator n=1 Tax=Microbacterium endophyticum TaxID=1526412 RepID=A0A7W4YN74_9MICO|nr:LacI family DNA-binding transcriptional regulator [Microbacterium endophyticum]MBB2976928.1 LacI family transcriptional regulator [Microbacterium endophyticum]NIK35754.1 LacI family transcriptional regulator [Microbacterium endophyticum]
MVLTHSRSSVIDGAGHRDPSDALTGRRTTLSSIAERAHVSVATVSKVVNGRTGVGEETRQRVQNVIAELGYVTHGERQLSASRLAEPTFELLVEPFDERNPYMFALLGGAMEAAGDLGAALVTRRLDLLGDPSPVAWARTLAERSRAGVIEVTTRYSAAREKALRAVGLPMVLVDPIDFPRTATMSIGATNWAGAYAATEHLLELGHTRIAYIGGHPNAACDVARVSGWSAAMGAAGRRVNVETVPRHSYTFEHGLTAGGELLDAPHRPTAIFAGSDISAMGVMEAARRRGIRVPEELSVVGFDDTVLARSSAPNLTTVHQPIADIGRTAVNALLRLARGETFATKRVELATHLVVRDSTAPPPP